MSAIDVSKMKTLQNSPLFTGASDDFFKTLETEAHEQTCPKGKILFIHEEQATHFYYVKKGWVKLYRETLDGTQSIVDIVTVGHIFGETCIFENNLYPYTAEIVENATIIKAPLSALKKEIETNNTLALNMLASMSRYRHQQDQEIEHRTIQNAPQRIGCFLLRLVDQRNTESITIHLPYDKTLMASRLGMQPETFSRALTKLREKTGIRVKGASIEMDTIDQLRTYSCSACSTEFPCKDLSTSNIG
ncbi:MAG: Crp/Fnr family transcriptional regulator [Alphaproteobacteria bacterium]